MMNNQIQIFDPNNQEPSEIIERLRKMELEFADIRSNGWVYALEHGDKIKIGCTSRPSKRFSFLSHYGIDYAEISIGRFAISMPCVNYRILESLLHCKFEIYRKPNTELFNISLDETLSAMQTLKYDYDFLKADSVIDEKAEKIVSFGKQLLSGNLLPNDKPSFGESLEYLMDVVNQQSKVIETLHNIVESNKEYTETLENIIVNIRSGKIELSLLDYFINKFLTNK